MFRILAIDGGEAGYLTSLLLEQLEERVPGFLDGVDLFAGTSSGGMSSLLLASREEPASVIPALQQLWLDEIDLMPVTPLSLMAGGLAGCTALISTDDLASYLAAPELLGESTLGDLPQKVAVTTFRLNAETPAGSPDDGWEPKVLHNLSTAQEPDLEEKATDAALSTSALPIMLPIHQGGVDGGTFANNPSMAAVAEVVAARRHEAGDSDDPPGGIEEVLVFSMSDGRKFEKLDVDNTSWGYGPWLLNPCNPLLLVNLILRGATAAVDFQCKHLLADGAYFRLDPMYSHSGPVPFLRSSIKGQVETSESEETQKRVDEAEAWIRESGWLDG